MDIQTPPSKQLDPLAQVRTGTVAFLLVAIVVVWALAANYDPPMAHPYQTEVPPPASATPTDAPRLLTAQPTLPAQTITPDVGMPAPPLPEVTSEGGAVVTQVSPPPTLPVGPTNGTARPTATVRATATAGQIPGSSLTNPIPAGTPAELGDGFILTVVDSTLPADAIVLAADPLNTVPEPDQQYLLVVVELTCTKPAGQTCLFFTDELMTVDAEDNLFIPDLSLTGLDEMLMDGDYVSGSTMIGELYYLILRDDPSVVLYHESYVDPEGKITFLAFH